MSATPRPDFADRARGAGYILDAARQDGRPDPVAVTLDASAYVAIRLASYADVRTWAQWIGHGDVHVTEETVGEETHTYASCLTEKYDQVVLLHHLACSELASANVDPHRVRR